MPRRSKAITEPEAPKPTGPRDLRVLVRRDMVPGPSYALGLPPEITPGTHALRAYTLSDDTGVAAVGWAPDGRPVVRVSGGLVREVLVECLALPGGES